MEKPRGTVRTVIKWVVLLAITILLERYVSNALALRVVIVGGLSLLGTTPKVREVSTQYILISTVLVGLICGAGGAFGWWELIKRAGSITDSAPPKSDAQPSPTALFFDCSGLFGTDISLPLRIAPGSSEYVLRLHPKMDQTGVNWGLVPISAGDKERLWPDKSDTLDGKITESGGGYRCELTNQGPKLINAVRILLVITFTPVQGNKDTENFHTKTIKHFVLTPPLISGGKFRFYVINQSPLSVQVAMPTDATIRVFDESTDRVVALHRPMISFPSDVIPDMLILPTWLKWKDVPELN